MRAAVDPNSTGTPRTVTEADVDDPGVGQQDELDRLAAALDEAESLTLDERLALLRSTEEAIARSLEGLDGL